MLNYDLKGDWMEMFNVQPHHGSLSACFITGDWKEQLRPLVASLKECVMEVVEKAKRAMTFVLLQEAACSIPQGFFLQQRRDVVFSQAVGGPSQMKNNSSQVLSNLFVLTRLRFSLLTLFG